jgi:uncharacterized protein
MKLHQQTTPDQNTIRSLEPGRIRVNDDYFVNSLIITADRLDDKWPVAHADQIDEDVIVGLLEFDAEIILLGTGLQHHLLDPRISLEAIQRGVGIEIMSTEAACHTYNILLGEDRAVLAALIIESDS